MKLGPGIVIIVKLGGFNMKKIIKELKELCDLKNHFPCYFNQKIFRFFFLIFCIVFVFTLYSNDWILFQNQYVDCPSNTISKELFFNSSANRFEYINTSRCYNPLYNNISCDDIFCEKKYLKAGETIGHKPSKHAKNLSSYTWILTFFAFITNHIFYRKKYGCWIYKRGLHK